MIPENFIRDWFPHARWQTLSMVEQDLIISRALICLYSNQHVKESLVFRGGTALNKLFIKPPARYSEDIDFVQVRPEPIGPTIDAIRAALKPWLGEPKRKLTERSAKLIYTYQAIGGEAAKLKIEINTTEHFQVLALKQELFVVESPWFQGSCSISTYELEELLATKLRALYQRRKGRDLFDMWYVLIHHKVKSDRVIEIFQHYCLNDGIFISKELFQKNMEEKRLNRDFQADMRILLPHQIQWNFEEAFDFVHTNLISKLP
ncbi:nucleotidyl transferase AbiEii/AbiGii toxin family protein [Candidatus Dependentiae bacterium]|nr:nucleotidyl transferase AbiEii/AbiGii toxin family protein [Candidatus Dependentiae bacterium]